MEINLNLIFYTRAKMSYRYMMSSDQEDTGRRDPSRSIGKCRYVRFQGMRALYDGLTILVISTDVS